MRMERRSLEGYLKGHFLQGGVISASSVNLTMRWRYAQ